MSCLRLLVFIPVAVVLVSCSWLKPQDKFNLLGQFDLQTRNEIRFTKSLYENTFTPRKGYLLESPDKEGVLVNKELSQYDIFFMQNYFNNISQHAREKMISWGKFDAKLGEPKFTPVKIAGYNLTAIADKPNNTISIPANFLRHIYLNIFRLSSGETPLADRLENIEGGMSLFFLPFIFDETPISFDQFVSMVYENPPISSLVYSGEDSVIFLPELDFNRFNRTVSRFSEAFRRVCSFIIAHELYHIWNDSNERDADKFAAEYMARVYNNNVKSIDELFPKVFEVIKEGPGKEHLTVWWRAQDFRKYMDELVPPVELWRKKGKCLSKYPESDTTLEGDEKEHLKITLFIEKNGRQRLEVITIANLLRAAGHRVSIQDEYPGAESSPWISIGYGGFKKKAQLGRLCELLAETYPSSNIRFSSHAETGIIHNKISDYEYMGRSFISGSDFVIFIGKFDIDADSQ